MRRLVLTILVMLGACGEQTGPPLPDPVPLPSRLRATEPVEGQVDVLGLPGAVPGVGPLLVTSSRGTVQTKTTAAGSFWVRVKVNALETLVLRFEDEAPVSLGLKGDAQKWAVRLGMTPEFAGEVYQFEVEAVPGETIVAANLRSGDVATATAKPGATSVRLRIPARSGDEIRVYLDGGPLSEPATLTVP